MEFRLKLIAFILKFLSIFFFPYFACLQSKFMAELSQKLLKLGIVIDNEMLNCRIENWTNCCYSSHSLSFFLSF